MSMFFLFSVAVMAWVGVLTLPGTYKYKVGDCIGFEGTAIAQVIDRRNGVYTVDIEPLRKEVRRPYAAWKNEATDDATNPVACPERTWR